jgi:hydrogenase maturation factor
LTPEHCVTCSDEAVTGRVVATEGNAARVVLPGGDEITVALDLIPAVAPGDLLLCHAGIALTRLEGLEGLEALERLRAPARPAVPARPEDKT